MIILQEDSSYILLENTSVLLSEDELMAFRTILGTAYRQAHDICTSLVKYVTDVRDLSNAGPISGNVAIALHERVIADRARLIAIRDLPGIGNYAKAQEDDPTYDVGAEFNTVVAAVEATRDWLITNVNTGSWVTFAVGGVSTKTFSSAATAGLRTQLDALIATIA